MSPPRFEKREMPTGGEPIKYCHDCRRACRLNETYRVPVQANWEDLPESQVRYEGWIVCITDAARRGII
jgi:hypothetical protein